MYKINFHELNKRKRASVRTSGPWASSAHAQEHCAARDRPTDNVLVLDVLWVTFVVSLVYAKKQLHTKWI